MSDLLTSLAQVIAAAAIQREIAMTTTPQRIDEIRDRLNKARPGLAEIDGGEEIRKRRGNPKGVYTWTLYGTYADAILLVNAKEDIACLLGEVERLSAERTQPEQPEPTDAEIQAAARAMFDVADEQMHLTTTFDLTPDPLADTYRRMARAALLAAREGARHD